MKMARRSSVRHRPCGGRGRETRRGESASERWATEKRGEHVAFAATRAVTHDEDGDEAGERGVPVAAGRGRGLSHQHAVEDEVSEAQLDAP